MKKRVKLFYKSQNGQFLMLLVLMLLSIGFLALPFVGYNLGWFSLISFVPFLFFIHICRQIKLVNRQFYLLTYLIGIGVNIVVMRWMLQTNPQKWAQIDGWVAIAALIVIFAIMVGFFALQYLLFAWGITKLKVDLLQKKVFLLLPAVWVMSEFVRSVGFSALSYGKGGSIGPYWNFGSLGVASILTPFGYLARLGGMFGLSFVVVVVGLCVFWLLQRRWKLPVLILASGVVLIILSYILWLPNGNKKLNLGFVQLPIAFGGFDEESNYFGKILEATKDQQPVEILVLPEYSDFFAFEAEGEKSVETAHKLVVPSGVMITSTQTQNDLVKFNKVVMYSPEGEIKQAENKKFLIPIGEYLPYAIWATYKLTNQENTLQMHEQSRVMSKGGVREVPFNSAFGKIGAMACSGAIAPELYRNLVNDGAEIISNSASLSIFSDADLYHVQSKQFARFNAVANARPYVQAAAGAHSYIIDSNGKFVVETNYIDYGYGQARVSIVERKTAYSILGEWAVVMSGIIIIVALVSNNKKVSKST